MTQHQLGQCLLGLGRYEEAVIPLEKAAATAPNVAQPHFTLGLALRELRDARAPLFASSARRSAWILPWWML